MVRGTRYNSDIINELKQAYATELPNEDAGDGEAYHMPSTNSVVSSCQNEERREMIQAVTYFEKATQTLLISKKPSDIQKAQFCRIAAKAIRRLLENNMIL